MFGDIGGAGRRDPLFAASCERHDPTHPPRPLGKNHDAIGQTGATVGHIEIEVAPQPQNANDANQRDGGSGREQQDSGNANSQNQSNQSGGGNQQQNSGWRKSTTIDEIDIDI